MFTTISHILNVLIILIFIYIVIFTFIFIYITLLYLHPFAVLYELDKIDKICENTTKFSRLKSMSSTEDNYLEAATGGVL